MLVQSATTAQRREKAAGMSDFMDLDSGEDFEREEQKEHFSKREWFELFHLDEPMST